MNVLVLGASSNPEKYSYQAVEMLKQYKHQAIPVHPSGKTVANLDTVKNISDVQSPIDTITLYVGAKTSDELSDQILNTHPRRIIMNPGAENSALAERARAQGIEVVEGCTLVMLRTGQF